MMQLIRDKAQGVIAGIIVAVIAIVFCFSAIGGYMSSGNGRVLAKVKNQEVTSLEVDREYDRWYSSIATQKGFDHSQINPTLIKQQITKALAEQRAVISMLATDGFSVSDAVLIQNLKNNPEFHEDKKFSVQKYREFLERARINESVYESYLRNALVVNQVQRAVIDSSFALNSDINQIIAIKNQKRSFSYTLMPAASYETSAKVNDAEVEDYYNKHAAQFSQPAKVQLEYVELSIDDAAGAGQVSENDAREYYQNNLPMFTEPELIHLRHILVDSKDKAKIDTIYSKLKSGDDFSALAAKDSIDKPSSVNGGDLGWITRNDQYPVEVFNLKNVKDFTAPVKTDYGWHIFQLVERKDSKVKDFAEVRKTIEQRLKIDRAEKTFASKSEELGNLAFEYPKSLQAISEKLKLPIKTTEFFDRNGGAGIASAAPVLAAAFSDLVYQDDHNSDLIRISDDTYVVIRAKAKQAQKQLSLSDVRAKIVKVLQATAARDAAKKRGEQLLSALKQDSASKADWKSFTNVERDSKKVEQVLLNQIFAMSRPAKDQAFTAAGFSLPNGDFAVVKLISVVDGVLEKSEDSNLREMIAKQLASIIGNEQYLALQADLVKQAGIKYE